MNIHNRILDLLEEFQVTIKGGAPKSGGSSTASGVTGGSSPDGKSAEKPEKRKMGKREREAYANFTSVASSGGRALTAHELAALERFRKMDELDGAYSGKKK